MSISQNQIKKTLSESSGIKFIRGLLESNQFPNRTALSLSLCEHFKFFDVCGKAQQAGCVKALRVLEAEGHFTLPKASWIPGKRTQKRLEVPVVPPQNLPKAINDIEQLELILVDSEEHMRIWNELMINEHPEGFRPLVGRQLRYLICSRNGWLGGLGFASAALQLEDRDKWIGWEFEDRQKYLHYVINMNRFLIRPSVNCQNLASKILSMSLLRLPEDFHSRYGYRPLLVESFVDDSRHLGTCYRAANWVEIGKTKGRGRQDRYNEAQLAIKSIYVYPLEEDFRKQLGLSSVDGKGKLQLTDGLETDVWAQNEFGGALLNDKRLSKRLVEIADAKAKIPNRAFTGVAQGDWPAVKGYYRFIDHPNDSGVNMASILAPHRERTIRRMMGQKVVLCIQDDCKLNFDNLNNCTGLGSIGSNQTGAKTAGLNLHSTFTVTPDGLPLGILRGESSAPTNRDVNDKRKCHNIPIEEKKTFAWVQHHRDLVEVAKKMPNTRLIDVCDREADFFELFDEQRKNPSVDLLIRAKQDRIIVDDLLIRDEKGRVKLFEAVCIAPIQSKINVCIPQQSERPKKSKQEARKKRRGRIATLTLRSMDTIVKPPRVYGNAEPLEISIIHAKEENPPEGEEPIEWFLLTTIKLQSAADIQQCLRWYCLRWRIEDWHRVMKSGCRIEDLANKTAERLINAVSINMVIAWRIMLMTLLGREMPELPAEIFFSDIEIKVLHAYAKKNKLPSPVKVNEAVRIVANIGGYLGRKNDPPPGHQIVWQGYRELQFMCLGFGLFLEHSIPDDGCG